MYNGLLIRGNYKMIAFVGIGLCVGLLVGIAFAGAIME